MFVQGMSDASGDAGYILEMRVRGYADIGFLEDEIGRLLQCDKGRGAACLESLYYMRFRCGISACVHLLKRIFLFIVLAVSQKGAALLDRKCFGIKNVVHTGAS